MTEYDIEGSNLLDSLRRQDRQRLAPFLHDVAFPDNHVLYEPGDDVKFAYFPRHEAIASHLVLMADGATVETALVGREGAIGGIVSNGRLPAFARTSVMHGGPFYRIASTVLDEQKQTSPHMRDLFARYADCLVAQVFQSVACNATHTIGQRAAKWLTAAMDRTGRDDITMTQDQLGALLGVSRTYVSRVVSRLKTNDVIATRRGGIRILDRPALDRFSCDCSRLVERHFDKVLAGIYPDLDEVNA